MSGSSSRRQAIKAVMSYEKEPAGFTEPMGDTFGRNVFGLSEMRKRLPKHVFKAVAATIDSGASMDPQIADYVAVAMKDWAVEKGATHYAHVFYPLTGFTAEKHDSFLEPENDGSSLAEFAGKTLLQGEPDASSFPNGGLRVTFEARGYTGWDVTSPAYILENPNGNTLCIPTIFISWTGEALDKKTPLLRSQQAMSKQAMRLLELFGHDDVDTVVSYAGAEQEYFLVDEHFYYARPDLMTCNRTLFGAPPSKGQEFDDHYFGAIPDRVLAFMIELDRELFKLGIPSKTRHNEVAPGQFEIAPVFERSVLAHDHQQLMMTTMKKVAEKYGMKCLLHEKPFAGVNGSGKHVNFSLGNANQGNLLNPGDTPHKNMQFLTFCGAIIRSVHKYGGLLRAAVASASNDHRLGANEAPPAIISIFLGDQLMDVFDQIAKGGATDSKSAGVIELGVDTLPPLKADPGDRNRTSPFAFTGNRFEYRAPGSNQSISDPMVAINTILADSLDFISTELEGLLAEGATLAEAVQKVLQGIVTTHGNVIFNGDGYSDAWQEEAASRGLKNLRTTVDAVVEYTSPEVVEVFERYGVLSARELKAREDVIFEYYALTLLVEAKETVEVATTMLLPAAIRFQGELAATAASLKAAGVHTKTPLLTEVSEKIIELDDAIKALTAAIDKMHGKNEYEESRYALEKLIPKMTAVREKADALEPIVADDLWPLPTYIEMLNIL
ncbi:MAG TPA: glutamine synthetase III [Gordonia sp. (in: high G+C Gram-positive bacteria)]|uniref:glutamine synthetase III family protein n=1 Tax=unclassified Gordonia (in: high G+C Gram-positive bacteria) TaxID=2657482 RepID=UPI000F961331|nr:MULTISPECIES: glutamine synthetase III [unclassified Gordonia (in: high G+C Gram-positive bacteria)]RUP36619.1 MAG: glutamine synthetase type III [Gordonia sp. (in: high G+C Gram-positive bacteria)]HNP56035.1 glutamine synthetase III [Gordonia sp. (in: high G+C Gram-positive bacteria)]HRC51808.1 glutamine synthetase III [Gordonia sp. (in: high G+C Gram-positive bacteria)]